MSEELGHLLSSDHVSNEKRELQPVASIERFLIATRGRLLLLALIASLAVNFLQLAVFSRIKNSAKLCALPLGKLSKLLQKIDYY